MFALCYVLRDAALPTFAANDVKPYGPFSSMPGFDSPDFAVLTGQKTSSAILMPAVKNTPWVGDATLKINLSMIRV